MSKQYGFLDKPMPDLQKEKKMKKKKQSLPVSKHDAFV